jgi:hypothetical protein
MGKETLSLKPSPLVSSLLYLYFKFPAADPEKIDASVIDNKFDIIRSEQILETPFQGNSQDLTEYKDLEKRYKDVDPNIGISQPHHSLKVYKVELDDAEQRSH